MTKITYKEILDLAKISRIRVEKAEAEKLVSEIEAVLEYASSLNEIAKMEHARSDHRDEENVMRDDVVIPENSAPLLAQAPERDGDYYVVPRIIKQN